MTNLITRYGIVDQDGVLLCDIKGTPLLFRSDKAAHRYTSNDGGVVVRVTVKWEDPS